jgi:hypothetical protein
MHESSGFFAANLKASLLKHPMLHVLQLIKGDHCAQRGKELQNRSTTNCCGSNMVGETM